MVTSFRIILKISFQKIWEEENLQDNKHDKQLNQNDQPDLFSPFRKVKKTFEIKPVDLFEKIHHHYNWKY